MADDVQRAGTSPKSETAQIETTEDAETRATRRELKQSSISDQPSNIGEGSATDGKHQGTPSFGISVEQSDELKERMSSPKKKRAHDQLDGGQNLQENDAASVTSTDSAKDRASRLEPEKKRHRDEESTDSSPFLQKPQISNKNSADQQSENSGTASGKTMSEATSSNTFANSAFGQLASGSSGFAALGSQRSGISSAKVNISSFASVKPTTSSEAKATAADKAPDTTTPKLSFGLNSGLSPFAGLSSVTNGFGGSGFGSGSALSGVKQLGSFAAAGAKTLLSDKAARPFGAPDSDADDEDKDEEDDADNESHLDEGDRGASPEKESDDKKRPKLHKIEVDDGETGEITVVSVRAKMFCLDKEAGWKERGAGMLKINVPHACVDFDDAGAVIPGSFDASCLEVDEESTDLDTKSPKMARLILRQDQTHRVILNTAILPAMEFQEKASLKSVGILFTALEGVEAKPISITMRVRFVLPPLKLYV
ncbi:ATP-dependent 3'-5' DNA helicase [Conoideocrella luteorostrata]|uniref:ATP-dependent 3'-5' DNA helicase n=1 Tax=Conoideocrella luteorostrata TaxID=1105319 RepID=A0AAJ0FMG7_9HYPO|nr:ATP-dependent 3'-5' DNA helicase [Conoideocrella luteorostrata]